MTYSNDQIGTSVSCATTHAHGARRHVTRVGVALLASVSVAPFAYANFSYTPGPAPAPRAGQASQNSTHGVTAERKGAATSHQAEGPITDIGLPNPSPCSGFSKGLALHYAVGLIVPRGWHVSYGGAAPKSATVSWACGRGRSWSSVLESIMWDSHAHATINWVRQTVHVIKAGSSSEARTTGNPPRRSAGKSKSGSDIQETNRSAPTSVLHSTTQKSDVKTRSEAVKQLGTIRTLSTSAPQKIVSGKAWHLHKGEVIGHALAKWAHKAHWHVVWHSKSDWLASESTTFHGRYRAVAKQVLQDLQAEGAGISARFYLGNKTLLVKGASK